MKIKGILFDKDGTLIEVNRTWVPLYKAVLLDYFGTAEAVEAELIKTGYDFATDKFVAGSILAAGTLAQLVAVWFPGKTSAELKQLEKDISAKTSELGRQYVKTFVPLEPLMAELRRDGYKLGIGTNDNIDSTLAQAAQLKIDNLFDDIIAADTVPVPKPSGEMIKRFAKTIGASVDEVIMVGDNSHDIEEGMNGGAGFSVGVLSGNSSREDLLHHTPHILNSIADLPGYLREMKN